MLGNSHPAVVAQLAAATVARKATLVAQTVYRELVARKLNLGKQPNGLILGTIWDAKPIAWRPRPVYQYDFHLEPAEVGVTLDFDEDIVAQYHVAYLAEKNAWSEHDICYQQLVAAWQRGEVDLKPTQTDGLMPECQLRIYEVRTK